MEVYSGALGHLGESSVFSVKVDEQSVFVEKYNDLHIAWFGDDFDNSVSIVVTVNEAVTSHRLSPTIFDISTTVDGAEVTFTLDQPRQLMLWEVNALDDRLLIIADYPSDDIPNPADADVDNIMDAGVDETGETDDTTKIQGAIDALDSGDTLYFPAGCYRASVINLQSDMTIYLEVGARLKAWDGATAGRWIKASSLNNVNIRGRGIIDGNERYSYNITFYSCNGASIDHILSFNPRKHPLQITDSSQNVSLENFYAVTTTTVGGGTGIHLTSSHDVLIEDCFVYSMDDAIAIGSVAYQTPASQYNITLRRYTAFLHASGSPLKFYTNYGHEIVANSHAITVEDVYVINVDAVFAWYSVCGSSLYNIQVDNVYVEKVSGPIFEIEVYDSPDSWWTGQYDCCQNEDGSWDGTPGTIHNVIINNVVCEEEEGEENDIGYYGQTGKTHDRAIYIITFNNIDRCT